MKYLYFLYSIACYIIFFATFLFLIAFVGNFYVPKTVDTGQVTPLIQAFLINFGLIAIFAIQHSVMARQSFKKWLTRIIPEPIERSTYVLFSSLALILLFWQWRPLGGIVWDLSGTIWQPILYSIAAIGWFIVLLSTFLLDHFELFGLKQTYFNLKKEKLPSSKFKTPLLYKYVRHPIYFGFTLAFWATPTMTITHLFFAIGMLIYTIIGIKYEEKDLISFFGEQYIEYKEKVSMLFPWLSKNND